MGMLGLLYPYERSGIMKFEITWYARIQKLGMISMLIGFILILSLPSSAAPIPSNLSNTTPVSPNKNDLETVRQFLENKMVLEKLKALGLNEAQAKEKLGKLNKEQIHTLAVQIDKLVAGGKQDFTKNSAITISDKALLYLLIAAVFIILILALAK
jgi:hypothetical protein